MGPADIASRAEQVAGEIRARGNHICFRYADVFTAYHSDEPSSSEWIEQFFEGYFLPSDVGESAVDVYSTADPPLFAALQELAAGYPAPGKREYVEIPFTDSVALIRKGVGKGLPAEDVFHLLFTEHRRIVLVTSGDLEVRREEGMQTLRAVNKWLLLEKGWIPMHSACAAKDGRVICIAGEKAAGKTSTLLNLLARNGCDLVAVDKFLVRDGGSHLDVCGVPGKIGVRVGSAIVQPRVMHWLAEEGAPFFPHLTVEEVAHIAATNTPEQLRSRGEKINLLPAELADLFGASITPLGPLRHLLIPVFDLDIEDARFVRAEPEQAIETLTHSYSSILGKGEGFLLHFFDLSDARLEQQLAALLDKYVPELAAHVVHQNHTTNEQVARLVAGVL